MSSTRGGEMRNQKGQPPSQKIGVRHNMIYDIDFKRAVVVYANKEGTRAAKRFYGVSESNIRRWKKIHSKSVDLKKAPVRSMLKNPIASRSRTRSRTNNRGKIIEGDLDAMPLQQRLKATQGENEQGLQSQPLSPTKLKVTRQSKQQQKPTLPVPLVEEEVSLKWDNHHSNIQTMFPNLLSKEQYVDATLVAEGQTLKCHRIILSLSSPYFEEVLSNIGPFQHPVLFMKDVPFWILKSLCDFIYTGEVQILQNKVEELLAVAESLKIRGLCEQSIESDTKNIGGESHCKQEPDLDEKGFERKDVRERKSEKLDRTETKEKKPDLRRQDRFEKIDCRDKKFEKDPKEKKKNQSSLPASEVPLLKPLRSSSRSLQQTEVPWSSKVLRSSTVQKRLDEKNKSIAKKEVLDTYDLLEPLYEEVQREPVSVPVKPKEVKNIPVKRSMSKKIRKRKISDTREDSPLPVLSKKGTRSRPNRKIPKFYQPPFETSRKTRATESTIIHEPHTDQADPLLQIEEIKTEPLDESVIEIEDNVVCFNESEIINDELLSFGKSQENKSLEPTFKKIRMMELEGLQTKSSDIVKIVDVASIKSPSNDILEEDPLNFHQNNTNITITNVQSLIEAKDDNVDIGFKICEVRSQSDENTKNLECDEKGEQTVFEFDRHKGDSTDKIKIANVFSENQEEQKKANQVENEQSDFKDTNSGEVETVAPDISIIVDPQLVTASQDYTDHDISSQNSSDLNKSTDSNQCQEYNSSAVAATSQDSIDFDKSITTPDETCSFQDSTFPEISTPDETGKLKEDIPMDCQDPIELAYSIDTSQNDSQNIFGNNISLEETTTPSDSLAQLESFPLVDLADNPELPVINEKTDSPWEQSNCIEGSDFMEGGEPTMDPTLSAIETEMVDYSASVVPPEGCSSDSLKEKSAHFMEELEGAISINPDRYQYDVAAENFTTCANSLVDDKMDFTEDNINFDADDFQIAEGISGQLVAPSLANDSELETIVNDLSKIVGESQDE